MPIPSEKELSLHINRSECREKMFSLPNSGKKLYFLSNTRRIRKYVRLSKEHMRFFWKNTPKTSDLVQISYSYITLKQLLKIFASLCFNTSIFFHSTIVELPSVEINSKYVESLKHKFKKAVKKIKKIKLVEIYFSATQFVYNNVKSGELKGQEMILKILSPIWEAADSAPLFYYTMSYTIEEEHTYDLIEKYGFEHR